MAAGGRIRDSGRTGTVRRPQVGLFSVLFADDAACLGKGKNLNELTSYVNQELNKIANWLRANKMVFNTAKINSLSFELVEND
jgi:hypothetical protein